MNKLTVRKLTGSIDIENLTNLLRKINKRLTLDVRDNHIVTAYK